METHLHRELKRQYADSDAATEVRVGRFRVDAIASGRLIEVQHASLAGIRDKVRMLLDQHDVTIVKPIIRRKVLVQCREVRSKCEPCVVKRRWSPRIGSWLDLFDDWVHFVSVFPHRRLQVEVPLVDIEEWRAPKPGRRRWRRATYRVLDQRLLAIVDRMHLSQPRDLLSLLAETPPDPFHTGTLGQLLAIPRWRATRIAYGLRHAGVIEQIGKVRNAILYRVA